MTDLTKITTPFGLLDAETQAALKAWPHGVEVWISGDAWADCRRPGWHDRDVYRAKPAPVTKPSIDWSHVAPEWKWLAQNADGSAYIYKETPIVADSVWVGGELIRVHHLASFVPGTCDWRDSLVTRPENA